MVSFFLPFFPLERSHIRQLFHMRVRRGQGGLWSRMGQGGSAGWGGLGSDCWCHCAAWSVLNMHLLINLLLTWCPSHGMRQLAERAAELQTGRLGALQWDEPVVDFLADKARLWFRAAWPGDVEFEYCSAQGLLDPGLLCIDTGCRLQMAPS